MRTYENNIPICLACEYRKQSCNGPCPCTVDGRDIIDHAKSGDCPKGKYSEPPNPPARRPCNCEGKARSPEAMRKAIFGA